MTYQDNDSYWHDKPCENGRPRSNNRNTYTAYSKYLAAPPSEKDKYLRQLAFYDCVVSRKPLRINRLPDKIDPPFSKDEAITVTSLGFVTAKQWEDNHWNFCNYKDYQPERLTFSAVFRATKTLYKLKKEVKENLKLWEETKEQQYLDRYNELTHRNYLWENEVTEVYCLLFYLPPWDQYYVKKFCGEKPGIFRTVAFYLNAYNVIKKGDKSSRMLLWLQCKDLNHRLLKYIDGNQWVRDYFEENHTFVKNLVDNK